MKLMVFVIDNSRAEATVDALVGAGFRVTRLASTGGWLRKGNTTLLVGLEDHDVDRSIQAVRQVAPGSLSVQLPLERFERL